MSTSTETTVRDEVVSWLRANLPADWVEAIENDDPAKLAEARKKVDYNDWCARLGEAGYATPSWPKPYGGAGLDPEGVRVVMEELDRYKVPRSFNVIGIGMGGPTVMQWGSEDMKTTLLPTMAQHREIWCQLFSEPSAGSDVATLATRAVRDGDEWIVNGQKVWTTMAHMAKWGMLVARTDPDAPKHKGLTYFIVDMHAPGVEVRPLKQMTGDAEFNEVFFTDVRIPDSMRCGDVGNGWAVATETLMNERVALSGAGSVGGGNVGGGAIDELIRARRRAVSGTTRCCATSWCSSSSKVASTRSPTCAPPRLGSVESGPGPEGSITKLFQAEYNKRLQCVAMEILGASATAWSPSDQANGSAVRGFLRSRANTIEGGTSEIMRNILGERVLGLPKEPATDRDIPWTDIPRNG